MADVCPHCGAALAAHATGSAFDDEPTPVDPRFGSREGANIQLLENEIKRVRIEAERLAIELAASTGRLEDVTKERDQMALERDRMRAQLNQLRLALHGRFKKT